MQYCRHEWRVALEVVVVVVVDAKSLEDLETEEVRISSRIQIIGSYSSLAFRKNTNKNFSRPETEEIKTSNYSC